MTLPANENVRLLVVDDEPNILTLLEVTFRNEGYDTCFVSGHEEALKRAVEKPFDIVISDHMMPKMTGIDLLKLIGRLHPHAIRFLLTAHVHLDEAVGAMRAGHLERLIRKPWGGAALLHAIREAAFEVQTRNSLRGGPIEHTPNADVEFDIDVDIDVSNNPVNAAGITPTPADLMKGPYDYASR